MDIETTPIICTSETYKVIEKNYKGKAKGWKDIKVGDRIQFSMIMNTARYCGRPYQTYFDITVYSGYGIKSETFVFYESPVIIKKMLKQFNMVEV